MGMNLSLQTHIFRKKIINSHLEHGMNFDDVINSDWEDYLDPTLEFSENLEILLEHGIIVGSIHTSKEQDEEIRMMENKRKQKYIDSLTTPYYKCQLCDEFVTPNRDFMLEHLQEEHNLEECNIPPENPQDMTYIILDELITLSQQEEFKNKKYIVVTNEFLWTQLLIKLGVRKEDKLAPSNQKPRQILDKLGILYKHKYQRINSIGYTKKAKRRYCIYKTDLKRAVNESDFLDLKYKFEDTP